MKPLFLRSLTLIGFLFSLDQGLKHWVRYSLGAETCSGLICYFHWRGPLKEFPWPYVWGVTLGLLLLAFFRTRQSLSFTFLAASLILSGLLSALWDLTLLATPIGYWSISVLSLKITSLSEFSILAGDGILIYQLIKQQQKV